jgi:adenosylhomocysteinase
MKSGSILANSGHFNAEIDISELEKIAVKKEIARENCERYYLTGNKKIYLLGEGRLVNLAAAEGHPSEVMDMSFANQALCTEYIAKNEGKLEVKVHDVPQNIDKMIAVMKLKTMGIEIDDITKEQQDYMSSWKEGTQ